MEVKSTLDVAERIGFLTTVVATAVLNTESNDSHFCVIFLHRDGESS